MYIGVDIGGTKCAVTKADDTGCIVDKIRFDTAACEETLRKLTEAVRALGGEKAKAIGVSCGGPLDSVAGVIQSPPNLPGWDDIPIVRLFEDAFGVRTFLQNDANACALAEWQFGAGKGSRNMMFLTFGTGFGAGLILNGRLYEGACGNAGEAGHIRLDRNGPVGFGKAGSVEGFCSGGGLAQLGQNKARELLQMGKRPSFCPTYADMNDITAKKLAECALEGCADALEVYRACGERLGQALAIFIDLLNPDRIVIGSIYQRSGSLMQEAMERVLQRECLPASLQACQIVPAALGDEIGDRAAISVAVLGAKGELG